MFDTCKVYQSLMLCALCTFCATAGVLESLGLANTDEIISSAKGTVLNSVPLQAACGLDENIEKALLECMASKATDGMDMPPPIHKCITGFIEMSKKECSSEKLEEYVSSKIRIHV